MQEALTQFYPGHFDTALVQDYTLPTAERLVIAVGARACRRVLESATALTRLLCIFLPSQTFIELTTGELAQQLLQRQRLGAVFLDQPLARQIRLALLLKPDARALGTAIGTDNSIV